jgi:hypothetical protein
MLHDAPSYTQVSVGKATFAEVPPKRRILVASFPGCPHASVQTPLHPSLALHAFPAQLGAQSADPHTFGPPPPQWSPGLQAPQSIGAPQEFWTVPHFPLQVEAFGEHVPPSPGPPEPPEEEELPPGSKRVP